MPLRRCQRNLMTYCCITILVFVCSCEASFANNVGFRIDNIQVHDIMQFGWLLVMLDQTQGGRSPGYEYLLLFHLPHLKIQVSHNLRDWNLASIFVPAHDSQTRGQSPTSLSII